MATFDQLEKSVEGSRPIELYTFALGTLNPFRYTSSAFSVTIGPDTWLPIAITRGSISRGPDDRSQLQEFKVPSVTEFPLYYVSVVPAAKATVTVVRLQVGESPTFATQRVVYRGLVRAVKFTDGGHTALIAAASLRSKSLRNLPRFGYQSGCNHLLYDSNCQISQASFQLTATVSAQTGTLITVPGAGSPPYGANYFRGGFVRPAGEVDFRLVVAQSGDVLDIVAPFQSSLVGLSVDAFAGCDHNLFTDCSVKFNNAINYGGHAFVPKKNPFVTGLD